MGRPPSNSGPAFRFSATEVKEMEDILKEHNKMPPREILTNLSEMFSNSSERQGKIKIHINQVWNWFQNKRYAIRAKTAKPPAKPNGSTLMSPLSLPHLQPNFDPPPVPHNDFTPQTNATREISVSGKFASDSSTIEFEAKSTKDGAWYDVSHFVTVKNLDSADPEILVRFAGFGPEDDEWLNVKKLVRQRSLPCESSDCVAVLAGDLILCFQEGNEQAIYFDAHVLDAQRRRHDVRGCRCRFLVRYDHDQFEEIVPLRKICRRPETDYRLQVLHTSIESSPQASHIMAQNLQKTTRENQNAEPATIVPQLTETVQEQSTSEPRAF